MMRLLTRHCVHYSPKTRKGVENRSRILPLYLSAHLRRGVNRAPAKAPISCPSISCGRLLYRIIFQNKYNQSKTMFFMRFLHLWLQYSRKITNNYFLKITIFNYKRPNFIQQNKNRLFHIGGRLEL